MRIEEIVKEESLLEWGRIVKGVNTTSDVDEDFLKNQAKKLGFNLDKDGRPKDKF